MIYGLVECVEELLKRQASPQEQLVYWHLFRSSLSTDWPFSCISFSGRHFPLSERDGEDSALAIKKVHDMLVFLVHEGKREGKSVRQMAKDLEMTQTQIKTILKEKL